MQKHTHTHTNTNTDFNKYPNVAFSKNATITRKRFLEKPIVAFTNSKVYMTKPVWSHVLPLSALTLNNLIINYQETRQIPDLHSKPYLNVQYILLVSFAVTLNHR